MRSAGTPFDCPTSTDPLYLLTRDGVLDQLNEIIVAPVTRTIRGLSTEVDLTADDGMPVTSVISPNDGTQRTFSDRLKSAGPDFGLRERSFVASGLVGERAPRPNANRGTLGKNAMHYVRVGESLGVDHYVKPNG